MEEHGTAPKSFLIRDLLKDLIVKNDDNAASDDDSGKLMIMNN